MFSVEMIANGVDSDDVVVVVVVVAADDDYYPDSLTNLWIMPRNLH